MKKNATHALLLVVALAVIVSGCAYATTPVTGFFYADIKAPMGLTANEKAPELGSGTCRSFLGLVALGDCSIDAAAKAAHITKIHHVDYKTTNYLFVYASMTVWVYGE